MLPNGPWTWREVPFGEGVSETVGGNLMGCFPMFDVCARATFEVENERRALPTQCGRGASISSPSTLLTREQTYTPRGLIPHFGERRFASHCQSARRFDDGDFRACPQSYFLHVMESVTIAFRYKH